ncbi:outer membrane protein TolC [Inhella inkyongensis]|uniref:Outer membrane protein TolC n=1 Tax=Inhella inkyongensis TaxID=392593 RepID=A0A840S2F1_9BURK|nr:TolC family protein [Inhella inkyongensis]MBB5202861.1 outer membrane protein TolC [Inhella inkyongensis]
MNKTILASTLALVFAAALGGCAVQPPVAPQVATAMPKQWQQFDAQAAEGAASWVDDAQLAALQAQALAANRDIRQAALRMQRAQLQLQGAGLDRQPTPSLGLDASRSRLLEGGGRTQRSHGANVGLSYELDLWQRLGAAEQAQAAQVESARTDIAAAQALIRAQVAERYWALGALEQERPLVAEQLQAAEQVLLLTRQRVREGKLLPIEVDKVAATLQDLRARQAQLQREQAQHRLALGLLLDQPEPALPAEPRLPATAPMRWQPAAPDQALAQRPDVQRARAQVDAALAQQRGIEAARYPRLSLTAGVGTGGAAAKDWLRNPLGSLAANLIVPLVDWRRLDLQRSQALTDVESAALSLRDTLHKALVEIEGLAAEERELQAQSAANQARLQEAEQTERLAQLRFEVGAIARADWLQARNARLAAEQQALQLRLRAWVNQQGLRKALAAG